MCFAFILGWINLAIFRNQQKLDKLYVSYEVEAEIAGGLLAPRSEGFIRRQTVQAILDTGYISNHYVEGAALAHRVYTKDNAIEKISIRAFDDTDEFFARHLPKESITYAPGLDETLFRQAFTSNKPVLNVIVPQHLLDTLNLDIGDKVSLTDEPETGSMTNDFIFSVAGSYSDAVSGMDATAPILMSLSTLYSINFKDAGYSVAEFVIDPALNRDLPQIRTELQKLVGPKSDGVDLLIWDEELRMVVVPMEKNIRLMQILYPVTVAVSIVIAAGLSLLLIMQSALTAAIMRVLGTTKQRAVSILCCSQALPSFIGLLSGTAALLLSNIEIPAGIWTETALYIMLYFAGAIAGALLGSFMVLRKMPIELLQVKE